MNSMQSLFRSSSMTLLFAGVIAAMVMAFVPMTVNAQSISDLEEQIASLRALIVQLQEQINAQNEGGSPARPFSVGDRVRTTDSLKVRSAGSVLGSLLGIQTSSSAGTVTEGPVNANGYLWYLINYDSGPDGWSASGWLDASDGEDDEDEDEETATYRGYLNGSLLITTSNITQADALKNCKLNAGKNPNDSVRCTWDGDEIYESNAEDNEDTATYRGYLNGSLSITTRNITKADALENCKLNADKNPDDDIRCTWDSDTIYEREAGEDASDEATYQMYLNNQQIVRTEDISYADALENCKTNAAKNPRDFVRCVWDGDEIYDRIASTDTTIDSYEGEFGNIGMGIDHIRRADALAECRLNARKYEGEPVRCMWGDIEIYDDAENDEVVAAPQCTISASKSSVRALGESVTFTWNAQNTRGAVLYGAGDAANPFDGGSQSHTMVVRPKTQILEIWGPGGTASCDVVVGSR